MPNHVPGHTPARQRTRRWPIAVAALAVLLVAYGAGVVWLGTRIGDDIEARMPSAPVVEDTRHRAD